MAIGFRRRWSRTWLWVGAAGANDWRRAMPSADADSRAFGFRVKGSPDQREAWVARLEELIGHEPVESVVVAAVK